MPKRLEELREELLTKARYGKITPEEAEAKAASFGLPSFAAQPQSAIFDPMAESRWPIVKAVAWIAWRDLRLVMEQGDEFRRLCTHFAFREWKESVQSDQILEGWFLEPWPTSTVARLPFLYAKLWNSDWSPRPECLTLAQAERELWGALSGDKLKAEGFDLRERLVEIPAREWTHLQLVEEHGDDVLKYDVVGNHEPYTKVHFRRDDLIRLWSAPRTKSKALVDCGRWLAAAMEQSPKHRPKSKAEFRKEAQSKFGPIAWHQFQRLWAGAIEKSGAADWSKGGRVSTKSYRNGK